MKFKFQCEIVAELKNKGVSEQTSEEKAERLEQHRCRYAAGHEWK